MDNLSPSKFSFDQSPLAVKNSPTGLHAKLLKAISTPAIERQKNSTLLLGFLSPADHSSKPPSLTPSHIVHSRLTPSELSRPSEVHPAGKSSYGSLKPIVAFPARSQSTSQGPNASENPSQVSSVASRFTKLEVKTKLKSRFSKSRADKVRLMSDTESQRADKRVGPAFLSPRTLGAHYDYHSQHLTFIPENICFSTENKTSFLGFDELAKTFSSTHQSILGNLVMEDISIQSHEGQLDDGEKKLKALKKKLEFNRLQKDTYDKELAKHHRERMLPLVKLEQERLLKKKQMKNLKVLPSQSFHYQTHRRESILSNTNHANITNNPVNLSVGKMKSLKGKDMKTEQTVIENMEAAKIVRASHKYKFFWYKVGDNSKSWLPDAREGHTLTTIGKHVVLYGGFSNGSESDIAIYSPGRSLWKQPTIKGDAPLNGRHGHSACEFKDCVIIFGGEEILDIDVRFREYSNDTRAFYPDTGEWKYLSCPGKVIGPRRNHAAAVHEAYMFVYGGVTAQGKYLNELWTLNLSIYCDLTYHICLESNIWAQLALAGSREPGIAFHQMCACFMDKNISIIQKAKGIAKSFEQGLYVFGGKDEDGNCLNTLKYLDLNTKPPQWQYPTTRGNPPPERYGHTMLFYQSLSLLLIYGGKNFNFADHNKIMELNDIRVLNLETMSWNPTYAKGDVPQIPRSNHAATLFGHVMIIFGGLGFGEYMPPQMRMVELNQRNAKKLIEDHDRQQHDNLQANERAASPTFLNGVLVEDKKEKKEGLVTFLPLPSQLTEEKTLKLKGTLKGAVAKVRILENWKKLKNSVINQREIEP